MTNTEETAVVCLLDQKGQAYFAEHYTDPIIHLATAVYVGSLLKLKDYPFNPGASEITVWTGPAFADLTPKNFLAQTELDKLLIINAKAIKQKITFPFIYLRADFWKALAANKFSMEEEFGSPDIQIRKGVTSDSLLVELRSQALQRSLFIDISGGG